jgi:hypothetical protein
VHLGSGFMAEHRTRSGTSQRGPQPLLALHLTGESCVDPVVHTPPLSRLQPVPDCAFRETSVPCLCTIGDSALCVQEKEPVALCIRIHTLSVPKRRPAAHPQFPTCG